MKPASRTPIGALIIGEVLAETDLPKGAMLVNVGRGRHVVNEDLIAALDSGQLSYAALDAHHPEPLPKESPLWAHPKVTVMPHVARRPTVALLVAGIAENIKRVEAGQSAPGRCRVAAGGEGLCEHAELVVDRAHEGDGTAAVGPARPPVVP